MFASTTSSAALSPAAHASAGGQPVWAKPGDELSRHFAHAVATVAPGATESALHMAAQNDGRTERQLHPARTTAPTRYGYAVNADTRQARCPSKVNTSSPKPNGNRRATRAAAL